MKSFFVIFSLLVLVVFFSGFLLSVSLINSGFCPYDKETNCHYSTVVDTIHNQDLTLHFFNNGRAEYYYVVTFGFQRKMLAVPNETWGGYDETEMVSLRDEYVSDSVRAYLFDHCLLIVDHDKVRMVLETDYAQYSDQLYNWFDVILPVQP